MSLNHPTCTKRSCIALFSLPKYMLNHVEGNEMQYSSQLASRTNMAPPFMGLMDARISGWTRRRGMVGELGAWQEVDEYSPTPKQPLAREIAMAEFDRTPPQGRKFFNDIHLPANPETPQPMQRWLPCPATPSIEAPLPSTLDRPGRRDPGKVWVWRLLQTLPAPGIRDLHRQLFPYALFLTRKCEPGRGRQVGDERVVKCTPRRLCNGAATDTDLGGTGSRPRTIQHRPYRHPIDAMHNLRIDSEESPLPPLLRTRDAEASSPSASWTTSAPPVLPELPVTSYVTVVRRRRRLTLASSSRGQRGTSAVVFENLK